MIYTVKDFGIISKEEVDVLLEFSCFFYDTVDDDNLTLGSSALFSFFFLPLFSLAPKSLQMVIAAMKLKDACSLEEKL